VGVVEVILEAHAEQDAYSYVNKERCEELVRYQLIHDNLAEQAADTALAAWKGLGCRDAGRVDLRADAAGIPNVIELNPLAGLHPEHSDLPIICNLAGISYTQLFSVIIASAMERIHPKP
jgi:D-alanine-D-alanine ligase